VTVVLHIRRTSGLTEIHRLPAEGDHVDVPHGLLVSDDVLGFDVELAGSDGYDFDFEPAGAAHGGPGEARTT
jgi:hypothetical protein